MGGTNSTLYCDPAEITRSLDGETYLITGSTFILSLEAVEALFFF